MTDTTPAPIHSTGTRKPRTLVLCFDGTSNEYDTDNTNIVKFFSLLKKGDVDEQLCYYQAGVGTYFNPGIVSPLFNWVAKKLDIAFAWYLDWHVMDGYRFLMDNWKIGDRICLFGFSRGAYTARALAGALLKVGLLPRNNEAQLPFAYKLYKREDAEGIELCKGFKKTYCQNVKIDFMGVWDTVGSVGVLMSRTLPFINSNTSIRIFRHALSLDERRAKFRPNLYHRPAPNPKSAKHDLEQGSRVPMKESSDDNAAVGGDKSAKDSDSSSKASSDSSSSRSGSRKERIKTSSRSPFKFLRRASKELFNRSRVEGAIALATEYEDTETPDDVLEVWFAGCHSDVGGGSVPNDTVHSLANIPLRWMVREVVKCGCAIRFDADALESAGIDVSDECIERGTEELDKLDVVSPNHDELKSTPAWWLLEIVPTSYTWQDAEGVWHHKFWFHFGKGRKVVDKHPKFHRSVKARMEALNYSPKAEWEHGTEEYVV